MRNGIFWDAMVLLTFCFFLVKCGGDNPGPNPTPGPTPEKDFVVSGKFVTVKGTTKSVSVEAAKAAVATAVKNLEK